MEGKLGLAQIQVAREVTDATFAVLQGHQHLEANGFGQGPQKPLGLPFCKRPSQWFQWDSDFQVGEGWLSKHDTAGPVADGLGIEGMGADG
jgi:hypothetical protein